MSRRYLGLPVPARLPPPRDGVVHDVVSDQKERLQLRHSQSTLFKFLHHSVHSSCILLDAAQKSQAKACTADAGRLQAVSSVTIADNEDLLGGKSVKCSIVLVLSDRCNGRTHSMHQPRALA